MEDYTWVKLSLVNTAPAAAGAGGAFGGGSSSWGGGLSGSMSPSSGGGLGQGAPGEARCGIYLARHQHINQTRCKRMCTSCKELFGITSKQHAVNALLARSCAVS
jgi:hypothetical protein